MKINLPNKISENKSEKLRQILRRKVQVVNKKENKEGFGKTKNNTV